MSGPIIRKYGFPNFEEIFGKREMKHGVEPEAPTNAPGPEEGGSKPEAPAGIPKGKKSE